MFALDFFAIVLGLVMGSFMLTVAMRLQDGTSLLLRSRCENCSTNIGIIGLIPVIGYIIQRGRCSHCKAEISIVYPVVEVINALVVWLLISKTGLGVGFFHKLFIFEVFLLIAIIDFRSHFIFPQPVLFGLVIQTIWLATYGKTEILNALFGLFMGAGVFHWVSYLYFLLRKREGLGAGDATLLGLIGFVFGWQILFPIIFWASVLGIVGGSFVLLSRRQSLKREIAFGPWLVLSAFLVWRFSSLLQNLPQHLSGIDLSFL